jgi:hypothetical protein
MRSAIYYPQTQVRSEEMMKSSLLLWDRLHTIVPFDGYTADFGNKRSMSEARELIGKQVVPDLVEKQLAHRSRKSDSRTCNQLLEKIRTARPGRLLTGRIEASVFTSMELPSRVRSAAHTSAGRPY